MRTVFYPINGVGLGHINRTACIARELKKVDRNAYIFFVTDSPHTQFIEKDFPLLRLPLPDNPINLINNEESKVFPSRMNENIFLKALSEVRPHAVVYDYKISLKALKYAESQNIKNILILRKKKEELMDEAYGQILKFGLFDKIIVPHEREEFGKFPSDLESRLEFVGPIMREVNPEEKNNLINKYDLRDSDFVISACCGGGGFTPETNKFLASVSKAYSSVNKRIDNLKTILIAGPLYKGINALKFDKEIKYTTFEPNLRELFELSHLAIIQGGYNTINEIIDSKTPSIIIPAKRSGDDQAERAKFLESRGAAKVIEYDDSALASAIYEFYKDKQSLLDVKSNLEKLKFIPGNKKAAETIYNLCKGCEELEKISIETNEKNSLERVIEEIKEANEKGFKAIELVGERHFIEQNLSRLQEAGANRFEVYSEEDSHPESLKGSLLLKKDLSVIVRIGDENISNLRKTIRQYSRQGVKRIKLIIPDKEFKEGHKEDLHKILRMPKKAKLGFSIFLKENIREHSLREDSHYWFEEDYRLPRLESVNLRVVQKCDAKCYFCDHWRIKDPYKNSMDDLDKILNKIVSLGASDVILNGGEPTVYRHLGYAIGRAKELGLKVNINTNGMSFANSNYAKKIMEKKPDSFLISFVSHNEEETDKIRGVKRGLQRSLEGLRNIRKLSKDVYIKTNTVIMRDNYRDIDGLVELVGEYVNKIGLSMVDTLKDVDNSDKRLNVDQMAEFYFEILPKIIKKCERYNVQLTVAPFFTHLLSKKLDLLGKDSDVNEEVIKLLQDKKGVNEVRAFSRGYYGKHFYRSNSCFVPGRNLYLMANGDVFPCVRTIGYDDRYIMGNVHKSSIEEIISQPRYIEFVKDASKHDVCATCKNQFTANYLTNIASQGVFIEE